MKQSVFSSTYLPCMTPNKLHRAKLNTSMREWISYCPENVSTAFGEQDRMRRIETQRRHAIENRDDLKTEIQAMETRLGIRYRWVSGSPEWERTKRLVAMAKYQRALDKLEGLVVARLFELTKLNMSRTGAFASSPDFDFSMTSSYL